MDTDVVFHHPPELTTLLIDTIPVLVKAKKDVVLFFKGAGVPSSVLQDVHDIENINKREIARLVISRLYEHGDASLREVVKRVVEWEDFSTCAPVKILKATGLVANIRKTVHVKDSFIRINQEHEAATAKQRANEEAKLKVVQKLRSDLEEVKHHFYGLSGEVDAQARGKQLEDALDRLFEVSCMLISEAFIVKRDDGEGIVEKGDGGIEVGGDHIWWR